MMMYANTLSQPIQKFFAQLQGKHQEHELAQELQNRFDLNSVSSGYRRIQLGIRDGLLVRTQTNSVMNAQEAHATTPGGKGLNAIIARLMK